MVLLVAIDVEACRNKHIEDALDVSLRIGKNEVKLTGVPTIDEGDGHEDSNQDPLDG
jgi:hypothetical protein